MKSIRDLIDTVILGDSAKVMQEFPSSVIDLTVTSPPYDTLRDYKGYTFDFEDMQNQSDFYTQV